ncbi:MAG TPA: hypothetical protein VKD22_13290 [Ramlibacter sp.]|nr:hypothetical protein [Ramlibacter sp.]
MSAENQTPKRGDALWEHDTDTTVLETLRYPYCSVRDALDAIEDPEDGVTLARGEARTERDRELWRMVFRDVDNMPLAVGLDEAIRIVAPEILSCLEDCAGLDEDKYGPGDPLDAVIDDFLDVMEVCLAHDAGAAPADPPRHEAPPIYPTASDYPRSMRNAAYALAVARPDRVVAKAAAVVSALTERLRAAVDRAARVHDLCIRATTLATQPQLRPTGSANGADSVRVVPGASSRMKRKRDGAQWESLPDETVNAIQDGVRLYEILEQVPAEGPDAFVTLARGVAQTDAEREMWRAVVRSGYKMPADVCLDEMIAVAAPAVLETMAQTASLDPDDEDEDREQPERLERWATAMEVALTSNLAADGGAILFAVQRRAAYAIGIGAPSALRVYASRMMKQAAKDVIEDTQNMLRAEGVMLRLMATWPVPERQRPAAPAAPAAQPAAKPPAPAAPAAQPVAKPPAPPAPAVPAAQPAGADQPPAARASGVVPGTPAVPDGMYL